MNWRVYVLFLMLFSSNAIAHAQFALPPSAKISIGKLRIDDKARNDAQVCSGWTINAKQVRSMFRTYHRLGPGDLHDYYTEMQCWIDGTLEVDGKTFHWEAQLIHILNTDWPDGVDKTLGGKYSGDLSGQ
jgi:hypothetical protein